MLLSLLPLSAAAATSLAARIWDCRPTAACRWSMTTTRVVCPGLHSKHYCGLRAHMYIYESAVLIDTLARQSAIYVQVHARLACQPIMHLQTDDETKQTRCSLTIRPQPCSACFSETQISSSQRDRVVLSLCHQLKSPSRHRRHCNWRRHPLVTVLQNWAHNSLITRTSANDAHHSSSEPVVDVGLAAFECACLIACDLPRQQRSSPW